MTNFTVSPEGSQPTTGQAQHRRGRQAHQCGATKRFSISSKVFPFVSFTTPRQKKKLTRLNPAKIQNVTAAPTFSNIHGKNCPTNHTAIHNAIVQIATAGTRTLVGKISLITIHVTGPSEKAKQAI